MIDENKDCVTKSEITIAAKKHIMIRTWQQPNKQINRLGDTKN